MGRDSVGGPGWRDAARERRVCMLGALSKALSGGPWLPQPEARLEVEGARPRPGPRTANRIAAQAISPPPPSLAVTDQPRCHIPPSCPKRRVGPRSAPRPPRTARHHHRGTSERPHRCSGRLQRQSGASIPTRTWRLPPRPRMVRARQLGGAWNPVVVPPRAGAAVCGVWARGARAIPARCRGRASGCSRAGASHPDRVLNAHPAPAPPAQASAACASAPRPTSCSAPAGTTAPTAGR
jgi:hypothetical protein